jgi:hypothetical protein
MGAYPSITLSANATSPPTVLALFSSPSYQVPPSYSVGLVLAFSANANLTATVQLTADQIPTANGNWANHDVLVNLTASKISNIAYPCTGIRLVVTGYSAGSVNLGIAQWP